MAPNEWLSVFLAYSPNESVEIPRLDRLRIQKGIFLFQQAAELAPSESYEFESHNYGPWSIKLQDDLSQLVRSGLIEPTPDSEGERARYRASDRLFTQASQLGRFRAQERQLALVEIIRGVLCELGFNELVASIYAEYPQFSVSTSRPELTPNGSQAVSRRISARVSTRELQFWADSLIGARELARDEEIAIPSWPAR